jgi:hypothetical protein
MKTTPIEIASSAVLLKAIKMNPLHIVSLQGQMPMKHASQEFEINIENEEDTNYEILENQGLTGIFWLYAYNDKESLIKDINAILDQMNLLAGGDDQYFDYNIDELDMVLYGVSILGTDAMKEYRPRIMEQLRFYIDNFNEEEHCEFIEYYENLYNDTDNLYSEPLKLQSDLLSMKLNNL